jgi:hypothetical protein
MWPAKHLCQAHCLLATTYYVPLSEWECMQHQSCVYAALPQFATLEHKLTVLVLLAAY